METILATAFGRAVNVQGGESDELTKAANIIFRSLDEGSATNFHLMIVLSSKFFYVDGQYPHYIAISLLPILLQEGTQFVTSCEIFI